MATRRAPNPRSSAALPLAAVPRASSGVALLSRPDDSRRDEGDAAAVTTVPLPGAGAGGGLTDEVWTAPLLDCRAGDLAGAGTITYRLEQTFRYDYDAPVRDLRHRLVVVPPLRHGDLRLLGGRLEVAGAPVRHRVRTDGGNTVVHVHAPEVGRTVEFRLVAVLERSRPASGSGPALPASALRDPRALRPTALTAPDDALRALAAELRAATADPADLPAAVCAAVHDALEYVNGSTGVRTTAGQALAGGRGVCQDSAHIMLALCHLLAIPARYVSGHLLGQGGTHAWVEVLVPDGAEARAVAFDPCNGCRAGDGHLTVATGRDYTDVAPTSGSFSGEGLGRLTGSRVVGVVAAA